LDKAKGAIIKDETSSAPKKFQFDLVENELLVTIALVCSLLLSLSLLPAFALGYLRLGYGQLLLLCLGFLTPLPILACMAISILILAKKASGSRPLAMVGLGASFVAGWLLCGVLSFDSQSRTIYFSLHENEYNAAIGLIQSGSLESAMRSGDDCSLLQLPPTLTSLAVDGTVCVEKSNGVLSASFLTWYGLDYDNSYVYRSDNNSPERYCRRLPESKYWFTC